MRRNPVVVEPLKSPRARMMASVRARKGMPPSRGTYDDFTVLSHNYGASNPAPAGRRTGGGSRRREEGASECGDTFAEKITIRAGGKKATLRPVATPRDFGDGGPDSVGWGTNKENRLQAKLVRKINKTIARLGKVAGQISPSEHEGVADAIESALDHIRAADEIHDRWVNRDGGSYPLAWSDDPAEYKAALDYEPFWDVYDVDQRNIVGCDPASVQYREQLSPSYRIADRVYGPATVRADPQRLTGSVRGEIYFPGNKYWDGTWRMEPGMRTYDLVRCPSPIEIAQRIKDRASIWDHYMDAAKQVRCAQYRLWSAIINRENEAPRRSNPGPRSGLDPVDPFDEIELVTETVDPFGTRAPTPSALTRAGQWTMRSLRRMTNPVEAIGSAVAHGVRKIGGIR